MSVKGSESVPSCAERPAREPLSVPHFEKVALRSGAFWKKRAREREREREREVCGLRIALSRAEALPIKFLSCVVFLSLS